MNHNDRQDEITRLLTAGDVSPLLGYQMLRANYACMSRTERTTDICRVEIALQDYDAIGFADYYLGV